MKDEEKPIEGDPGVYLQDIFTRIGRFRSFDNTMC